MTDPKNRVIGEAIESPLDKEVFELQDSPMMKSVREMQDSPTMKALREMQDSPTMKTLREMQDSPTMKTLREMQDSPMMKAIREMQDSPMMKALREMQDSPMMKAIREMQDSPMMKAVREMQDSPTMKAVREMQGSPMMKAIREMQGSPMMKVIREMQEPSLMMAARFMQTQQKELEGLRASPLFDYLVSGSDRGPRNLLGVSANEQLSVADYFVGEVVGESSPQAEADQAIVEHLQRGADPSKLPAPARTRLHLVLWLIAAIFNYLALENGVREELCFLQPKLLPGMTSGRMGKAVRQAMCEAPLEMLKGYRLVKGEGVRLRAAPSMKAEILQLSPQDGAVLEVLSTENRDWLHVSVVGESGVEGWISRKYTRRLVY